MHINDKMHLGRFIIGLSMFFLSFQSCIKSQDMLSPFDLKNHCSDFYKLSGCLHSSNTNLSYKIIDSIISQVTDNNKSKFTFEYNNGGRIRSFNHYVLNNDIWIISGRVTYSYDESGNKSEEYGELWTGTAWINDYRIYFLNDIQGNQVGYLLQSWDENNWINNSRQRNEFESGGNKISSVSENWVDSNWVYSDSSSWYYEEASSVMTLYLWNGSTWMPYGRNDNTYDSNGVIISTESKMFNGNSWNNLSKILYTYGISENINNLFYAIWYDNDWLITERFVYSVDEDNFVTGGQYEYLTGKFWTPGVGIIYVQNPDNFHLALLTTSLKIYYQNTTAVNSNPGLAAKYSLEQNYPNPFNPVTSIQYEIPKESHVTLKVYNILGEEVAILVNEMRNAGIYTEQFNSNELPSGIYLYTLNAEGISNTRKMIILK